MTPELRIYPRHIRSARLCMRGARRWFESRQMNWNDFLTNGISADLIRELDDPISNRALAEAEKEAN